MESNNLARWLSFVQEFQLIQSKFVYRGTVDIGCVESKTDLVDSDVQMIRCCTVSAPGSFLRTGRTNLSAEQEDKQTADNPLSTHCEAASPILYGGALQMVVHP